MKSRWTRWVLVAVLMLTACAASSAALASVPKDSVPIDWVRYYDNKLGLSWACPADWQANAVDDPEARFIVFRDSDESGVELYLSVWTRADLVTQVRSMPSNLSVAGMHAVREDMPGEMDLGVSRVSMTSGARMWRVVINYHGETAPPEFNTILESIRKLRSNDPHSSLARLSGWHLLFDPCSPDCGFRAIYPTWCNELVPASEWNGVPVYSNGGYDKNCCDDYYGYKFQCVELSQRFYWEKRSHEYGSPRWGVNAGGMWDTHPQSLEQRPNGQGQTPEWGDILVWRFSDTYPYGHTAVVTGLSGDTVYWVQQNIAGKHRSSASFNASTGTINTAELLGWLHYTGDGGPSPSPTPTTGAQDHTPTPVTPQPTPSQGGVSGGPWTADYWNTHTCFDDHDNCNGAITFHESIEYGGGDTLIDKTWTRSPGSSVGEDDWTGRFQGTFRFEPGYYAFRADHDDKLLLKFGDYGEHRKGGSGNDSVICYDGGGGYYLSGDVPITLYLAEESGNARLRLRWSTDCSICDSGGSDEPDPPTNVSASDGDYGDKVRITWNASADATSYKVLRSDTGGANETELGQTSSTNWDDPSVTPNRLYTFWVQACGDGCSGNSAQDTGYAGTLDTEAPVVSWISPDHDHVVRDGHVILQASASDSGSGVDRVSFNAKVDGQWRGLFMDYDEPFEYDWDLCADGVPLGDVELGLQVWDRADNTYTYSEHYTNHHIDFAGGCEGTPGWLLMYYINTDDKKLGPLGEHYVHRLQAAAGIDGVSIAVLWDGYGPNGIRYYYIDDNITETTGPELDTGQPRTLIDFVAWARAHKGGTKQALIIHDHGNINGVSWDDHPVAGPITLKQLGDACDEITQAGGRLDVAYMDVCLMGTIEGAYQLRGLADYYVANEAIGWAPQDLHYFESLQASTSPEALARSIVDSVATNWRGTVPYAVAAYDLGHVDTLAQQTSALALRLRELLPGSASTLARIADSVQRLDNASPIGRVTSADQPVDLHDFCRLAIDRIDDGTVDARAQAVMDTLDDHFIIAYSGGSERGIDLDDAHGISIFFPNKPRSWYIGNNLDFAQGTVWGPHVDRLAMAPGDLAWGPMLVDFVAEAYPDAADEPEPPDPVPPNPWVPDDVWVATFEAEDGVIDDPLVVGIGGDASGCYYVGNLDMQYDTPGIGSVVLTMTLPADDLYFMWTRGYGVDYTHNSWYAIVDGGEPAHLEIVPPDSQWQWQRWPTGAQVLAAGEHTLQFNGREAGSGLDAIVIANHPGYIPAGPLTECEGFGEIRLPLIVSQ